MFRKVLHSKIHMAGCTGRSPDYMGSITIDAVILDALGLRASDAVSVANCRSGHRFETYIFRGEAGRGDIVVNGAAAHLVEPGDKLIIMHYAWMNDDEYRAHRPRVAIMNAADNSIDRILHYEPDV